MNGGDERERCSLFHKEWDAYCIADANCSALCILCDDTTGDIVPGNLLERAVSHERCHQMQEKQGPQTCELKILMICSLGKI